ncbi:uncharacterized protein LOC143884331 isoform X2 [Tasmannia lanceolata]|uniref:uncharacterized protein LOC143884331 isoform X2 n=1 Tax=Tasmannia lanceolata TaxID=3420 RepID=UPI00406491F1
MADVFKKNNGDTSNTVFGEHSNGGAMVEEFPVSDLAHAISHPLQYSRDTCLGNQPSGFIQWDSPKDGTCNLSGVPLNNSSFPRPAQMFIDAIKKNRSCQKFVRSKLIEIEARIEENKELKRHVKCLVDFQVSCRRKMGKLLSRQNNPYVRLISLPKPRISNVVKVKDMKISGLHFGPNENSHVPSYKMVMVKFPVSLPRRPWSKIERENLTKGIKQQFQEMLLQKSMEGYSGSEGSSGDSISLDSIIASIAGHEITPENIRSFLPHVDWERLASMYVMGHSGAECEARWLNIEDPLINHSQWTNLEDKNLLFIAQQRGIYNWIEIATSLGANRTPFQCLARYQRSLNANVLRREWTQDEDAQLRAVVEALGEADWQLVASNLEGRVGPQCSNRWRKTLHPSIKRVGRWSVDEDKHLKIAVTLFGPKQWMKIAQFVPGRAQVQCRERWLNALDPSLNLGQWTEEEDSKLKAAITEHGHCWSKVAAFVPPRTDSQCRRRWKVILPHEVPLVQAARKIQRAALITNFVDREEERPALGPNDFMLAAPEINSLCETGNENAKRKQKKKSCEMPDSVKQITSCSNYSSRPSTRKPRSKAKTRKEESLRTVSEEVETLCGDDTLTNQREKKRPSTSRSKQDKCIQVAEGHEDLVSPEHSILDTRDTTNASLPENLRTGDVSQKARSKQQRAKGKAPVIEISATTDGDGVTDNVNRSLQIGNNDIITDQALPGRKREKKKAPKQLQCPGNEGNVTDNVEGRLVLAHIENSISDIMDPNVTDNVEGRLVLAHLENSISDIMDPNAASFQEGTVKRGIPQESRSRRSKAKSKAHPKKISVTTDSDDVTNTAKRRRIEFVPGQAFEAFPWEKREKKKEPKLPSKDQVDLQYLGHEGVQPVEGNETLPHLALTILETLDSNILSQNSSTTPSIDTVPAVADSSKDRIVSLCVAQNGPGITDPGMVSQFSETCCNVQGKKNQPRTLNETNAMQFSEAQPCYSQESNILSQNISTAPSVDIVHEGNATDNLEGRLVFAHLENSISDVMESNVASFQENTMKAGITQESRSGRSRAISKADPKKISVTLDNDDVTNRVKRRKTEVANKEIVPGQVSEAQSSYSQTSYVLSQNIPTTPSVNIGLTTEESVEYRTVSICVAQNAQGITDPGKKDNDNHGPASTFNYSNGSLDRTFHIDGVMIDLPCLPLSVADESLEGFPSHQQDDAREPIVLSTLKVVEPRCPDVTVPFEQCEMTALQNNLHDMGEVTNTDVSNPPDIVSEGMKPPMIPDSFDSEKDNGFRRSRRASRKAINYKEMAEGTNFN